MSESGCVIISVRRGDFLGIRTLAPGAALAQGSDDFQQPFVLDEAELMPRFLTIRRG